MRSALQRAVRARRPSCPIGQTATTSAICITAPKAGLTSQRTFVSSPAAAAGRPVVATVADARSDPIRAGFHIAAPSRSDGRRPAAPQPMPAATGIAIEPSPQRKPVANRLTPQAALEDASPDELHEKVVSRMHELDSRFKAGKTVHSEETFDEYDMLVKSACEVADQGMLAYSSMQLAMAHNVPLTIRCAQCMRGCLAFRCFAVFSDFVGGFGLMCCAVPFRAFYSVLTPLSLAGDYFRAREIIDLLLARGALAWKHAVRASTRQYAHTPSADEADCSRLGLVDSLAGYSE